MKIIFFQNIKNKGTITETYVRLKDNQSVFSFDSGKRIDEANLKNYVLVAVNGKELLLPDYGIKLSSLVNGRYIHMSKSLVEDTRV